MQCEASVIFYREETNSGGDVGTIQEMDWTCLKSSQFQQILSALPVYSVVVAGADRISDKSKHNM